MRSHTKTANYVGRWGQLKVLFCCRRLSWSLRLIWEDLHKLVNVMHWNKWFCFHKGVSPVLSFKISIMKPQEELTPVLRETMHLHFKRQITRQHNVCGVFAGVRLWGPREPSVGTLLPSCGHFMSRSIKRRSQPVKWVSSWTCHGSVAGLVKVPPAAFHTSICGSMLDIA